MRYACSASDTVPPALVCASGMLELLIDDDTTVTLGMMRRATSGASLHYGLSKRAIGALNLELLWRAPLARVARWDAHELGIRFAFGL